MSSDSFATSAEQTTSNFSTATAQSKSRKRKRHPRYPKTILTTDKEFLVSNGYKLLKKQNH